jgi:hypothetical protein
MPKQSCFTAFRRGITGEIGMLVDTTFVMFVLGLINFILHFVIYGKDDTPKRIEGQPQDDFGRNSEQNSI